MPPPRNRPRKSGKLETTATEIGNQSPIMAVFQSYRSELDAKHDRHERIVKLSRDITIESKRIIFLLHSIDPRKNNIKAVVEEAEQRLQKLIAMNFKAVAAELLNQDPYQYRNGYSPGLQEFIEAYTFMEYIKHMEINEECPMSSWESLQQKMQYKQDMKPKETTVDQLIDTVKTTEELEQNIKPTEYFKFFVDPTEFILGVSDLTGELMRRCINSLGSGDSDACLSACKVLQQFYTGYIGIHVPRCRDLSRKIYTMRQSLLKAENVCYNVKVRGSEAAKWGAVFENKQPADDVDEGFF